MQCEGRGTSDGSELYIEAQHNDCTGKCYVGFFVPGRLAVRDVRGGRPPPMDGRRPVPSTGQNTVRPSHSGLRPPFTRAELPRSVQSRRNRSARPTHDRPRRVGGRPDGGVQRAANLRLQDPSRRWSRAQVHMRKRVLPSAKCCSPWGPGVREKRQKG